MDTLAQGTENNMKRLSVIGQVIAFGVVSLIAFLKHKRP